MKTPVAPRGSAQFNLRMPDDLRDRIEAAARKSGRSMNTEIVVRLVESLEAGKGAAPDAAVAAVRDEIGPKLDRILQLLEKK